MPVKLESEALENEILKLIEKKSASGALLGATGSDILELAAKKDADNPDGNYQEEIIELFKGLIIRGFVEVRHVNFAYFETPDGRPLPYFTLYVGLTPKAQSRL